MPIIPNVGGNKMRMFKITTRYDDNRSDKVTELVKEDLNLNWHGLKFAFLAPKTGVKEITITALPNFKKELKK